MLNEFLDRINKAKDDNSQIIDVIMDIYFALKFNPDVQKEFESLSKHRPFEDIWLYADLDETIDMC